MNRAREFLIDLAEQISMPEIYLEIHRLIKNPYSEISDYVPVVETDSSLAVRLIRIANSPYFGIPNRVKNLNQAISLIGVIQLHDIMRGILCMRAFSSMPTQILNQKAFWQYCTQCGIAARIIAHHCAVLTSNHYFTLGLLHEVGHAAMYVKEPELCMQVIEESEFRNMSLIDLEREKFGFDYVQLSVEMMRLWHLPPSYFQASAFHLEPGKSDPVFRQEALTIHLAHIICQDQVAGHNQRLITSLIDKHPQLNQLPADIETIVLNEINTHGDTVLSALWPGQVPIELENRQAVNQ